MFNKKFNPYTVTDKATFRNVDKTLTLTVRADASALVIGMKHVYDAMRGATVNASEEEQIRIARLYADTVFGKDQGSKLYEFYGEPLAVINVLGMYFNERLGKKITNAQKKVTYPKKAKK